MLLFLVAICVIIALIFLTRRKPASPNPGSVAPPAPTVLAAEAALAFTDIDELNRAAKERRQSALSARWWNV